MDNRDSLAAFLIELIDPLAAHTSPKGALIHLGHTGTHYDPIAAALEGFSRPLWGLSALLAGGYNYQGAERWISGLKAGTDEDSDEFWGAMRDRDQRMVECSAIGFTLAVARPQIFNKMSPKGKESLEKWLGGMNDKAMPNTNWLWFRVFANLGLSRIESKFYNQQRMKTDLDHLDTFYIADGWSRDGPQGIVQLDYYSSSFAIQFAQLVYSRLAQKHDPVRCQQYRDKARLFAQDFLWYFDTEGRCVPFGRSLTYRFATSAFWGALAYAFSPPLPHEDPTVWSDVDLSLPTGIEWGHIKHLLLGSLRFWARTPGAYNVDKTLSIGYFYPNGAMTENYNSPGSPYWAFKAFLPLALPETHPFWTSPELPHPIFSSQGTLTKPLHHPLHLAVSASRPHLARHLYILSSGQACSYPVKNSAAKYGKLAYSSAFGFSVAVGNGGGGCGWVEVGGDSTIGILVLDEEEEKVKRGAFWVAEENWIMRRAPEGAMFERSGDGKWVWLRSVWRPVRGVEIETWLVAPSSNEQDTPYWHLRVHRIRSTLTFKLAESSFSIDGQHPPSSPTFFDNLSPQDLVHAKSQPSRALLPLPNSPRASAEASFYTPTKGARSLTQFGTWEGNTAAEGCFICAGPGVVGIAEVPLPSRGDGKYTLEREPLAIRMDPNTSLYFPRSACPTLMGTVRPTREGDVWVATGVFGVPARDGRASVDKEEEGGEVGPGEGWKEEWGRRPVVPQEIVDAMGGKA